MNSKHDIISLTDYVLTCLLIVSIGKFSFTFALASVVSLLDLIIMALVVFT